MKTMLITGANRGIGLEFCKQYAVTGWRVLACGRRPEDSEALNTLATSHSEQIIVHALDVGNHAQIQKLAKSLSDESIDLLINNAGVYNTSPTGTVGNADYETWMHSFLINTIAPLRMVQAFTSQIARSGQKTTVTISSQMGSIADNTSGGSYIYRTSKAAVNMIVKTLAIDLKSTGITSVALHPSVGKNRHGRPECADLHHRKCFRHAERHKSSYSGRFWKIHCL